MTKRNNAVRISKSAFYTSASILPLLFVSGAALAQNTPAPIPDVNVQAPPVSPDLRPADIGTASAASGGMYVPAQTFGPFGALPAKDLPYSTNSVPQKIIQDQQDRSLYDILQNDPTVTQQTSANATSEYVNIRGFSVDYRWGYREDGVSINSAGPIAPELIERIDILKGLDGFLYGFSSSGGLINEITKKPLDTPLTRYTESFTSRSTFEEALDVSRRFGPYDQLGIRVNLATENGNQPIDLQKIDRNVEAVSLDWKPVNGLKIWGDFSHDYRDQQANQAGIKPNTSTFFGSIIEPPNLTYNYGQPWYNYTEDSLAGKIGVEFKNSDWEFRTTAGRSGAGYQTLETGGLSLSPNGALKGGTFASQPQNASVNSVDSMLTRKDKFGFIENRLNVGQSYSDQVYYEPDNYYVGFGSSFYPVTSNFYAPNYIAAPPPINYGTQKGEDIYHTYITNIVVNDSVKLFDDRIGIMAGIARPTVYQHNTDTASPQYDTYAGGRIFAPQFGVYFRPVPQLTGYVSYMEAYQPGGLITDPGAQNYNTILQPYVSKQNEMGLKVEITPALNVNAAIFQIRVPAQYDKPTSGTTYIVTQDGEQKNEGLEIMAAGKVTNDLKIFGGAAFTKGTLYNTSYANGSEATGIPGRTFRLFCEYALPWVKGLSLNAGVFYTSEIAYVQNKSYYPAYTKLDLGARYETVLFGKRTVARLNIDNALNGKYWAAPGYIGDPLTVKASLQFDLD